jgi:hypothetical protein
MPPRLPLFSYGEKAAAASLLTPAGARCGIKHTLNFQTLRRSSNI